MIPSDISQDHTHHCLKSLTLLRIMEFSKLDKNKSQDGPLYVLREGSKLIVFKNIFFSLKIIFVLANSAYPMRHFIWLSLLP